VVIHLYTFTYNEMPFLPFWLDYNLGWADRITAFDNGSTDGTVELLASTPRVTVGTFTSEGHPEPEPLRTLRNSVWKASRETADWVVLLDSDEGLYHPAGVRTYLENMQARGVTLIRPCGCEVVSEFFPVMGRPLLEQLDRGVPAGDYSKPVVFRPGAVRDINLTVGCLTHEAKGDIRYRNSSVLMLLHFKRLGWDHYMFRVKQSRERAKTQPNKRAFGHFSRTDEELRAEFEGMLHNSMAFYP